MNELFETTEPKAKAGLPCSDLLGIPSNEEKRIGFAHDRDLENGKEEWLTPPYIIEALGRFDLDPCAPIKRPWPTAGHHFTIVSDGLLLEWHGRVWCNPPYGPKTGEWMKRCVEHKNVTALIFARTETKQFHRYIWPYATAICFIEGRLSFYHVTGKEGGTAGAPSVLVTWDESNAKSLLAAVTSGKIKGHYLALNAGMPNSQALRPGQTEIKP